MAKLTVVEYASLDGVIQAPATPARTPPMGSRRAAGRVRSCPDHRRYNTELYQTAGAFLLGRLTYQIFAEYWPTVTDEDDEIARALNGLPKYVASTTLDEGAWQPATVLTGDLAGEVAKLKAVPGRPILVVGSAGLAQTLMRHGLVDEYQLWLHPVVLGGGKRLFRDGGPPATLRLVDSRTTTSGLVILTYQTHERSAGVADAASTP